jgi:hypothetical protein
MIINRNSALAIPILGIPLATAWLATCLAAPADTNYAAYVNQNYQAAQARYQQAPAEVEAAWQFGRALFDLAHLATNKTERAKLAERGIGICQQAVARQSNSAPAHYYLAMNIGKLAQTRGFSALRLVNQMEREFARARELDERLDSAGPDRNLGLLYRDAPSIVSVGNRGKARQHLKHAAELAPDFPENRLNLIEAYVQWSERKPAQQELASLAQLWPRARTNLAGVAWVESWADWEPRFEKLKAKLGEPSKALGAPHAKN